MSGHTPKIVSTRFHKSNGDPIQTIADIAEVTALTAFASERAELYGLIPAEDAATLMPRVVAYTGNGPNSDKNAVRLAAAWNATASLPVEALEAGVVEEMVEALRLSKKALHEAEAILGGEYGDTYGVLSAQMSKLEVLHRALLSKIGRE